ncbi:hypothetical protein HA464_32410 (plasmid) [Rhizobium leguminosarum bv. trifolii]|uniref:hypothetical protein n=1 Tax=Rhizobium TaxID=379 RepID=UPI00103219F9|nr:MULTISPECIES: hypothetical protein [Rhizobium]MBY3027105.1 hypothetical protein [Rhizobium leguminosarum]QIO48705.1 hypothetical protein HA464_32410 [Rhizobium leguminosarum bv. trifolii]TAW39016.1 hypothetical protein ELI17_37460 [Rhizobium ruizarguesonis]TAY06403.1 hypothetical protein ELH92_37300 [Rhizobium ruizarguesonis]
MLAPDDKRHRQLRQAQAEDLFEKLKEGKLAEIAPMPPMEKFSSVLNDLSSRHAEIEGLIAISPDDE